ncbi:MAG: ectonucleotide pyrophosphatase/phosphodiesterase, partial [Salinivirgaceae bacterium]|nr:ectonucleotide pyrophosphatase/phosphodiesterase [Salinivirgaceae bacterium]
MINLKKCFAAILFLMLIFIGKSNLLAQCDDDQITIVLSLDGFRWDYAEKTATPTLNLMAKEGVRAESLIPSFPTNTFPNHYTIATGLYPAHHGLVNNSFYDPALDKSYAILNKDARYNPDFYNGEPIWITAQKQGLHTASFYWVGADVAIQNMHPDYWKDYNGGIPLIQRID